MEDWRHGGFGLYIHWPFCASKCPYCDFNSHVAARIDQRAWLFAYRSEIARIAVQTGPRLLNSVFFGGGTPSLMQAETVAGILDAVRDAWPIANDIEITLEANPGSVDAARFNDYAAAGVNRVSMGLQALNDADLRRLGRTHTVDEARRAFDVARAIFPRVSFDLIYARQDQTLANWQSELKQALTMAVDHLSLYQLTIEDGTVFGARNALGQLRGLPDEDLAADMYDVTQELCAGAGLAAYEVSNHARTGSESRHNLIYWRCGDYAGIGPGAHGRLTLNGQRHATEALRDPAAWLSQVTGLGHGDVETAPILGEDQAKEYLLMGLRLSEGLDMDRWHRLSGRPLSQDKIAALSDLGLVDIAHNRLFPTPRGRAVLNALIRELAPDA